MGELKKSFLSGVLWEGLKKYSQYFVQLFVSAILARLLSPEDFGIIAIVLVYNGFVQIFTESGISSTIVQKKDFSRDDLSTIFWFSFFLGVLLTAITFLLSDGIETMLKMPGLSSVVKVLSVTLLFSSLASLPSGLLRKSLKFKKLTLVDLFTLLVASIASVSMAYFGWGYWALVANILIVAGLPVLMLYIITGFTPRFRFSVSILKEVLSYSLYVTGFRAINYWARNADNLLIGKFIGSNALGYYSQAYKLLLLPINLLTNVLSPVLHPIFSKIKDDREFLGNKYLTLIQVIAVFSFPIGVFLFSSAYEIITFLWGDRWAQSVEVFRILAVLTLIQPIASTTGGLLMATDNVRTLFILGLVNTVVIVFGIFLGLSYGINGVAVGYVISYVLFVFPVTMYVVLRVVNKSLGQLFTLLVKPMFFSIILMGVYYLMDSFLAIDEVFFSLIFKSAIFALMLTTLLYFGYLKEFRQIFLNRS